MRPRTASETLVKRSAKHIPGPGNYSNVDDISLTGKYFTSKYKNSKCKVWDPKRSGRFGKSLTQRDMPGPGSYKPKNELSGQGVYVLSNNVSSGKRFLSPNFGSFIEHSIKKSGTPGPGSYRLPSDFGHYDEVPNGVSMMMKSGKSSRPNSRPATARR